MPLTSLVYAHVSHTQTERIPKTKYVFANRNGGDAEREREATNVYVNVREPTSCDTLPFPSVNTNIVASNTHHYHFTLIFHALVRSILCCVSRRLKILSFFYRSLVLENLLFCFTIKKNKSSYCIAVCSANYFSKNTHRTRIKSLTMSDDERDIDIESDVSRQRKTHTQHQATPFHLQWNSCQFCVNFIVL